MAVRRSIASRTARGPSLGQADQAQATLLRPREPVGQRIIRWAVMMFGTQSVVVVLNLFTGTLAARVMGPAQKGLFNAVIVWPGVFFGLTAVGLSSAFTTLYARAPVSERRRMFSIAMYLAAFWGLVGAALCITVAPRVLGHLGAGVQRWVIIGSLVPVPTNAVLVSRALLSVEEAFVWVSWVNVVRALALTLWVTVLAASGQLTPVHQLYATWTTAFVSSLPLMVAAIRRARTQPLPPAPLPDLVRTATALTRLGFSYYAVGLAATFNAQLDQLLASAWLSSRDIGLYAVAASGLSAVSLVGGAFSTVFFPMVAAESDEEIRRRTVVAFRRGLLVLLAADLALVASARPVLWLLYGTRYLPAWPAVVALAPAGLFSECTGILYQGCYALRLFAPPTVGEVVGAVSGALLLVLLIPRWGILGAGLAGSVSYALDLWAVAWMWSRLSGVQFRELAPRIEDATAVWSIAQQQLGRLVNRAHAAGV